MIMETSRENIYDCFTPHLRIVAEKALKEPFEAKTLPEIVSDEKNNEIMKRFSNIKLIKLNLDENFFCLLCGSDSERC